MATGVISSEISSTSEGPARKRWTRSECALLEQSGLWDGQRFELIEGELYNKMGKGRPHTIALTLLRSWIIGILGQQFIETEPSIDVAPEDNPTSEPEPDLIVLMKPTWAFTSNPTPADIRLVVEVSDNTLDFDRKKKASLYARAGMAEYWVLDVKARSLFVHRNPVAGQYQSVKTYSESEAIGSGVISDPFSVAIMLQHPIS